MSTSTNSSASTGSSRREISRDLVAGLVMLVFVAIFLGKAGEVSRTKFDWLFPVVLGYTLGVLALILVGRGLLGRGERMPAVPIILRGQGVDVAVFGVLTIVYVALVVPVGFWVSSAVLIVIAAVYLDTRRSTKGFAIAVAVALFACSIGYLTLTQIFYIQFPLGPWW